MRRWNLKQAVLKFINERGQKLARTPVILEYLYFANLSLNFVFKNQLY